MNGVLLSICIPTNGASQWVLPCLDAIYSQGIDKSLFEVVITDNDIDSTLLSDLRPYECDNLRYVQTRDEGFLNLVTALKLGRGVFRKMLNHRSMILPGTIARWLAIIKEYMNSKPIIYFSDNQLDVGTILKCSNLDSFINRLSYWSSWSAGISIWDIDVGEIDRLELNEMFPNVSLLFNLRSESQYIICDEKYQNMQDERGKGGYNLFQIFAVDYLDILNSLRREKKIKNKTFIKVKMELLTFLSAWYFELIVKKTSKYNFEVVDRRQSFSIYYSVVDYYLMCIYAWLLVPFRRLIKYFYRKF